MRVFVILAIICSQTIINSVNCQTTAAPCPSNTNYCLALSLSTAPSTSSSTACSALSTSDFITRNNSNQQFLAGCVPADNWGPHPYTYPSVTVPANCNSTQWQQQTVVNLIKYFISQGWNYCHHHAPGWLPPASARSLTSSTSGGNSGNQAGQCSTDYWSSSVTNPVNASTGWYGIDCTTYTSFVYNFAFGCYLTALTGDQACGPNAPGRVLPYTASQQSQFQPGDILFIAANSLASPLSISHGILWTGIQLTYDNGPFSNNTLIQNLDPSSQQGPAIQYINQQYAAGQPVYVISDSHFAGPNYRPFAGWYVSAFTFARRLINPDPTLPTVAPNALFANSTCTYSP